MSDAALMDWLQPRLPGFLLQFGRWDDTGNPAQRYAVLKPVGGGQAELVRRPQWTLTLVGATNGDRLALKADADSIVEALRSDAAGLVFVQPAEPVFLSASDGRPIFELALAAITN